MNPRSRAAILIVSLAYAAPGSVRAEPARTGSGAAARARFEADLHRHATALTIPGIAYAVIRDGDIAVNGQIATGTGVGFSTASPLRFASVTKAFTGVLLMRAVEQGRVSLDQSASRWLPEMAAHPQITLRHLAAHVSEGDPGQEYVYGTNRYAKLGEVLRAAFQAPSFEAALRKEIFETAGIPWLPSPDLGAHAALVSTVDNVSLFVRQLQRGALITPESFRAMTRPYTSSTGRASRVGVGWFTQQIGGETVVWSFGQDDPDHSSALVLMLPQRRLALVLLANTDELSNPFRLLMGDIRYSPFATAFIDAFAAPLASGIGARERLLTDALAAAWREDLPTAAARFRAAAALGAPGPEDFVPHFLATLVADDATRAYCEKLDTVLLAAHPANRWALLMSGGMNAKLGRPALATQRYEALLALRNQEPDFLSKLFQAWACAGLARALKDEDRVRARGYVDRGLATGVAGGTRDDLLRLQVEIGPALP